MYSRASRSRASRSTTRARTASCVTRRTRRTPMTEPPCRCGRRARWQLDGPLEHRHAEHGRHQARDHARGTRQDGRDRQPPRSSTRPTGGLSTPRAGFVHPRHRSTTAGAQARVACPRRSRARAENSIPPMATEGLGIADLNRALDCGASDHDLCCGSLGENEDRRAEDDEKTESRSDDTLHSSSNRGIGSRMIPKAESCCRVSDYYRVGIVEEFEQDVKDPRQGRHRKHQERQHRPPVKERGP